MRSALIGYTGFVGQNLLLKHKYTDCFNSKNIEDIQGGKFDLLVCSGIPAEMYLSSTNPQKDWAQIEALLSLLKTVKTEKAVLISTIAVYPQPVNADELCTVFETHSPYGKHRRVAEELFHQYFPNGLVVRLPALFGKHIKKNFLFDIINPEPAFLKAEKFDLLSSKGGALISKYYCLDTAKNMYAYQTKLAEKDGVRPQMKELFQNLGFTSLQFTNCHSQFQFYSLENLQSDIDKALSLNIKELNICSDPLSPKDIMVHFFHKDFLYDTAPIYQYNMRSVHAPTWGGEKYLYSKQQVLTELENFFISYGVNL